jgi:hypothetical protein
MKNTRREQTRREIIKEIKSTYEQTYGQKISDSDARAMMRGETDSYSYRMAFDIMQSYGWD